MCSSWWKCSLDWYRGNPLDVGIHLDQLKDFLVGVAGQVDEAIVIGGALVSVAVLVGADLGATSLEQS